ncbi:MAG TPA: hypothetical protein VMS43_05010 [Allosphingosinicella sp.]|nr:hypothetical protein [Allosphingosinicella sp.]
MTQIDIGVRRLDGGKDDYAMVAARNVAADIWAILDNDVEEEEGCALEFKPGNLVTLMDHKDADGFEYPVAMRLYAGTII